MKIKFVLLTLFFSISFVQSIAQEIKDSIILLNGRSFIGEITKVENDFLSFNEKDKKGNLFTTEIATYRIFSYHQNNSETVLYKEGGEYKTNFLSVESARNATLGSYDARKTFKPKFVFWSSLVLGYGATLFDTYLPLSAINDPNYIGDQTSPGFFKSSPTISPILVPITLSVVWSLPSFRIKEHQILQKTLLNNADYYRGFHRVSKQKRVLTSLKGSLIGIGLGLVSYGIFRK